LSKTIKIDYGQKTHSGIRSKSSTIGSNHFTTTREYETLMHLKASGNSSVPPSKDENRPLKNQSLCNNSGKKVGGQKGHKGSTPEMTNTLDFIISYQPNFCKICSKD
jgi:hypothetical protein